MQNKKYILAALGIMAFLIPIHAPSVLFSIPILIIYSLFHKGYIKKEWRFFSLFLLIPLMRSIFYSFSQGIDLTLVIKDLAHSLQFHKGWGVLEIKNSPFELYSPIGYFLAGIGIISTFVFCKKEKIKKITPFVIWPLITITSILIFRETGTSYLVPYQRNLYYLAISLPILSSIGLWHIINILKSFLENLTKNEKVKRIMKIIAIFMVIILTFSMAFANYFDTPKNLQLYKLIDKSDYKALKFLRKQPEGKVMSPIKKSVAIKPIAKKESLAVVYFYNKENRWKAEKFFSLKNCETKKEIIKNNKIKYVLSDKKINCDLKLIYDKKPLIYKIN